MATSKKKILKISIIVGLLLAVTTVIIIMVVPWGEYESDLEKSEITDQVEFSNDTTQERSISLDEVEGSFIGNKKSKDNVEILFNVDGMKATKGGFDDFEISFEVPEDYTKAQLKVSIVTQSINTGNDMRDEHLREEEFFHAEAFPKITFNSTEVSLGDTSYIAKGELTMNGNTKALDVPFLHLGSGGEGNDAFQAFEGAFSIDRTEFGQEESSGVGNIVRITFYCELKQQ